MTDLVLTPDLASVRANGLRAKSLRQEREAYVNSNRPKSPSISPGGKKASAKQAKVVPLPFGWSAQDQALGLPPGWSKTEHPVGLPDEHDRQEKDTGVLKVNAESEGQAAMVKVAELHNATFTAHLMAGIPSSCAVVLQAGEVRVATISSADTARTGIRAGDRILAVGEQRLPAIALAEEVRRAFLRVRKPFTMSVHRGGLSRLGRLRGAFDETDSDHKGYIVQADHARLYAKKGVDCTRPDVQAHMSRQFKEMGPDSQNRVSWERFLARSVETARLQLIRGPPANYPHEKVNSVTMPVGKSKCAFTLQDGEVLVTVVSKAEHFAGVAAGDRVLCAGGRVVPAVATAKDVAEIFGSLRKPFNLILRRGGAAREQRAATAAAVAAAERRTSIPEFTVVAQNFGVDLENDVPEIAVMSRSTHEEVPEEASPKPVARRFVRERLSPTTPANPREELAAKQPSPVAGQPKSPTAWGSPKGSPEAPRPRALPPKREAPTLQPLPQREGSARPPLLPEVSFKPKLGALPSTATPQRAAVPTDSVEVSHSGDMAFF
jgi:hypothetical protein